MIAVASDESEREALKDARRVCDLVRRIPAAADRQAVIGVLKQFDTLAELADAVADGRILPFPDRFSSKR